MAPRLARDVTSEVAEQLAEDLRRSYDSVAWETELVVDRLVEAPASRGELLEAARRKLLESGWDLAVVVTDLPLREGARPATHHVGATHGVVLLSLPALGALHLRQRLHRTLLDLVGQLIGDDGASRWSRHALRELATETLERSAGLWSLLLPHVAFGHARLLVGMVRANRPWQLAARLYGALVAALAAGAYGIVTSDIWRLAAAVGWIRLTVTCVVSITLTVVTVIAVHELWERAPNRDAREQVILFNVATAATVALGILTLYVALFVLILAGAELLVAPRVLGDALGRPAGQRDYAVLAWFVASLATVGGALGAGLESDEAVRAAAYGSSRDRRG